MYCPPHYELQSDVYSNRPNLQPMLALALTHHHHRHTTTTTTTTRKKNNKNKKKEQRKEKREKRRSHHTPQNKHTHRESKSKKAKR